MENNDTIKLEDFPFHHKMKTRWRDLDAFRHINNAFKAHLDHVQFLFFGLFCPENVQKIVDLEREM